MTDFDVKDTMVLMTLLFILGSLAMFWKLYVFKPPTKTEAELQLQHKSHAISNEATQLQSVAKQVEVNPRTLKKLVVAMQMRERQRSIKT